MLCLEEEEDRGGGGGGGGEEEMCQIQPVVLDWRKERMVTVTKTVAADHAYMYGSDEEVFFYLNGYVTEIVDTHLFV